MAYATIEEANNILGDDWAVDDTAKQNALNIATIKIDSIMTGFENDLVEGQETVFPLLNQTYVPAQIKYGCIYEAGAIASGKQDLVFLTAGLKSESTSSASASYQDSNLKYQKYSMFYSKNAIDFIYSWTPKASMIGKEVAWYGACY
jgi:hypothetical protein